MEDEEVEQEMFIEKYPKLISIEETKKIINQMENCICKIFIDNGEKKGTGFFCNIHYEKDIPVMMTNYHVIDDKYIKENNKIDITLNDNKEKRAIKLNDNRIIYTNKEYDITIIEIKPEKDKINNFMKIDEQYLCNTDIIYDKSIYVIQYPLGGKASVSYGIINKFYDYHIEHYCNTETGSSGSPIINLTNHEIIGIHKESLVKRKINRGTLLKYPIDDFINKKLKKNEIEITIKVEKEEINKEIYYLDNTDYEDGNKIKHYHDNLKELNENNVDLYINKKKCNYKKFFKPKKEGEYKIKLEFKNDIEDCSFMFAGCENIIDINLLNFNTKNVKNMRYMFSGCENIKELDLSKFNTENVTNMEGMFGCFDNLSYIDLSLFESIKDLKDLEELFNQRKVYFNGCSNLENLNLSSSFNTQNVTNMMYMFYECSNLKNLNLPSSFNIQNFTNVKGMFYDCNYFDSFNLPSSFDKIDKDILLKKL